MTSKSTVGSGANFSLLDYHHLKVRCQKCVRLDHIRFVVDALPKKIDKSFIRLVATLVKANWEEFAVNLGLNARDLPQYQEKSKDNFIRAMMVIEGWVAKCDQKTATVDALLGVCEMCGIHRNYVKKAYREKQSQ